MNNPLVQGTGDAGPVLFCLHGLLGCGAQFAGLSSLSDRYRVQVWDAPGYGRTPDAVPNATLGWYAEQAAKVVESSADAPVHLLGTGWGGMIAMELAATRRDLSRSVIVANSALGLRTNVQSKLAETIAKVTNAGFAPELVSAVVSDAASAAVRAELAATASDGLRADGYAAAVHSMEGVDLAPRLRDMQLPALVIAGEDAAPARVQDSQDVSAAIADAVFVTMHQAGGLAHLEQPETFATWVRSFLYIVDRVRETE